MLYPFCSFGFGDGDSYLIGMKSRISLLIFFFAGLLAAHAQTRATRMGKSLKKETALQEWVKNYEDSLLIQRHRIDSLQLDANDIRYSKLFTPLTFYHAPAHRFLRLDPRAKGDSLDVMLDQALMNVYLNRPDLVKSNEARLDLVGAPIADDAPRKSKINIVEEVAPKAMEAEAAPVSIVVKKPNFWKFSGDYYLQFLQNYVSDNWYKGGESNYSMLGSITLQANYNNKQKVKWDNKLEMRLGYQTSKGDTIHKYKTSEDLLRYTGKLGLQATKKWYYSFQLIAQTQFTKSLKSNDKFVYSDFMSPFKLNLSVGMDYSIDWLNHRLKGSAHIAPLAFNWQYVGRSTLVTRYGLEEGHHGMTDYGSEFTLDFTWAFADNIRWKTRLYGYTTYERAELEWENTLSFQFNKYISTNIFLYPRFDDGAKRQEGESYWQFKEYASVGFSYSF